MKAKILLKFLIVLAPLFFAAQIAALSQTENQDVFDKVLKKYSGVKSVSFNFQLAEKPEYKGKIKAKLGNKYMIESGNRTITCNGKTIWNYTRNDNKVVLSSYEEAGKDEVSIEKIFFNFLQDYKAVSVTKSTSSFGPAAYQIVLEPKVKAARISSLNLTKVTIRVSRKDFTLLSLAVNDNGEIQTWSIKSIKMNQVMADSDFNFTPPAGASVVDLR